MEHPPTWNIIAAPRRARSLPRNAFIQHLYLGHVTRSSCKTGRTLGHLPSWNEIHPSGLWCGPEVYATNFAVIRMTKLLPA